MSGSMDNKTRLAVFGALLLVSVLVYEVLLNFAMRTSTFDLFQKSSDGNTSTNNQSLMATPILFVQDNAKTTQRENNRTMKQQDPSVMTSATNDGHDANITQMIQWLQERLRLRPDARKYVVDSQCKGPSLWACVDPNCSNQLSNDVTARVESLLGSPKTSLTDQQNELIRSLGQQIPESDVILITAASSNHYDESQALLHNLHQTIYPKLKNFTMVMWDIGLTAKQRQNMEKCCRCLVVSFPFEKFSSSHRDVRCYMWKPLVIRASLSRARKYLVWQDASIRFFNGAHTFFERAQTLGLQLMRKDWGEPVAHQTLPEMFDYMNQTHCAFNQYPELMSGIAVFKNEPFVQRLVVEPWARCAMERYCLCPRDSHRSHYCPKKATHYGQCHRFDQSALSVITATLYQREVYRILIQNWKKYFQIARNHQEANYFNSTGCLIN
ncbi:unnamed protein product [Lymnaea stagnalis]|uniref:Uncharacterized protein n=1 Tax=Lymnaea stagnalis TaxID=6523 RepID=A0AAV2HTJ5_LYMST